ncbi:uncharacterized protein LOC111049751 [Nilaparvata lugens]|uniref:uncharacterized protein LOC111049751 n=1 Tax=Nilaparvata lugens TaxID=108931 RepID=UPI000B99B112|nr:uncharacterized protein LOC111049751 [Nilaparvata lugens]
MSSAPHMKGGQEMVYPYTYVAKLRAYPWKFLFNNSWVYRHHLLGFIISMPLFYKVGKMVNTPENKKKWKEIRDREWYGHGH